MAFLAIIVRAFGFMVVAPLLAYVAAKMLLPWHGFVIPMAGSFDLPDLAAVVVFLFGFLVWARYPSGRGDGEADEDEALEGDGSPGEDGWPGS